MDFTINRNRNSLAYISVSIGYANYDDVAVPLYVTKYGKLAPPLFRDAENRATKWIGRQIQLSTFVVRLGT